jgi:hypothetical protein
MELTHLKVDVNLTIDSVEAVIFVEAYKTVPSPTEI